MLCEKKDCTGCFSCYNICPKKAIEMIEDEFGYIYPQIDKSKCINCGLCKKTCPVLNQIELNNPIKCLAIRTIDNKILRNSSSGGIATIISKKIIESNGIVYGASFVDNCVVNHIRIDSLNQLDALQGSKYVHSYINDTYKNIKKDLNENRVVLFIGTPCQVAGLRKFLMKDYSNLFTIDIICHGVPSQKFLKNEVLRINKSLNIERVNFRDKKFSTFHFSLVKNGKTFYYEEWYKSPYFYTFMNSYTYRDNCYSCRYASSKRCSDMTIGDFWGISENSKFYKTRNKGVSVVLPITNKGILLLNLIKNDVEYEERPLVEAINGNDQLREPCKKSNEQIKFKKVYKKNNSFYKTYKVVFKKNYIKQKLKDNFVVSNIFDGDKPCFACVARSVLTIIINRAAGTPLPLTSPTVIMRWSLSSM